jgi:hypothetical protein
VADHGLGHLLGGDRLAELRHDGLQPLDAGRDPRPL